MMNRHPAICLCVAASFSVLMNVAARAQWNPTPNDTLVSPRLLADSKVEFKIYAPAANKVMLSGTDIPDIGQGAEMARGDNGVWQVTIAMPPGAYRYSFNVDGTFVLDPRNPVTSESNTNAWSLVHVNGSEFMDMQDVPHGAIAEVTYYSKFLERFRRMHVYTPPGYELGKGEFPVFYLLHGAFDCDDSWTTVGRAAVILDNLIAAKKAKPMVVVMPAGHTGPFDFGKPRSLFDDFVKDFVTDIMPFVEKHYRVRTDSQNRAIAGLSMGGGQTLNIAIPNPGIFGYIGVYSSGVFGITGTGFGAEAGPSWEEKNREFLDNPKYEKDVRLVWFATGVDDFLLETSRATVEMLRKHGYDVACRETEGGHTWTNWREYLYEFAPRLFQ